MTEESETKPTTKPKKKKAKAIKTSKPTKRKLHVPKGKVPVVKKEHGSKSSFIRSVSVSTPAADVVAQGKAAGLKFNVGLVYAVRASAKNKKAGKKQKKAAALSHDLQTLEDTDQELTSMIYRFGSERITTMIAKLTEQHG